MPEIKTTESVNDKLVSKIGTESFLKRIFSKTQVLRKSVLVNCPFHDDEHPSLAIYMDTGRGKCFACLKKTNLVELFAVKNCLSYFEASRELLHELGLGGGLK